MINGRFYTTEEVMDLFGVSKQRVHQLAREHGIEKRAGTFFNAEDVTQYAWSRWRYELARQLGITVNGLVTHDEWDRVDNCPVCGGFAIWKPASPKELANTNLPVYGPGWPWRCVRGHGEE